MSKQLVIALVATIFGIVTIGVGLFVLSQTPATTQISPGQAPETKDLAETHLYVPQIDASGTLTGRDISDLTPGSEPWCDAMMDMPDHEFQAENAKVFADHCIYTKP
ncbi:DUF3012 domain-containing protein [Gilvimarinus sp. SDUM040013]|uniref:DUF3012 domain-containing protein n=1 Tax=Gilvimarinus gilvus TaxID=3058038 RepID=A0ABU4S3P1_9GAMM|nr:DUF3012 domain-containing protein [Gilvimarinus sp. SDUM040013]MDO3385590.1 DUF3012 domain-containing protein [Gilvimarinus sp. SDUM040013]MDX6849924.1 DUF3012 domain-containing protein [Gilvimarinus sp. SDUM040013]